MRPKLTFANVTSVIALFVALGGTSYAAVTISGSQIRNGTITGAKIKRGTLQAQHFKAGQLPAGRRGRAGARGVTGPAGPRGAAGPAGATNIRYRFVESPVPANNGVSATAECKPGERLTGGGSYTNNLLYSDTTELSGFPVQPASPDAAPTQWTGGVFNDSADTDGVLRVFAICAAP